MVIWQGLIERSGLLLLMRDVPLALLIAYKVEMVKNLRESLLLSVSISSTKDLIYIWYSLLIMEDSSSRMRTFFSS